MTTLLQRLTAEREATCCPELARLLLDAETALRKRAERIAPKAPEPEPAPAPAPTREDVPGPTKAPKVRSAPARKATRPGKRPTLPRDVAALRQRCREMRDRGLSLNQIGRAVGLHHTTVLHHLRRT